jgi:hypothetical protein
LESLKRLRDWRRPNLADDEYLGWELTAVAAKIMDAKGGFRSPGRMATST